MMTSRIPPVEPTQSSDEVRELLERTRRELGSVPRLYAIMANAPAALRGYLDFRAALARGRLPASLREQLALLIAEMNGCRYCVSAQAWQAAQAGIAAGELVANRRGKSADPKAAAALSFATAVFDGRGQVTDRELSRLRTAGFDNEEIGEIIAHVALDSFVGLFSKVARPIMDFPAVALTTDDTDA
ncbi:MAG: carboxymuconolactone decarboxylase family protein [Stellaceae bacterium]